MLGALALVSSAVIVPLSLAEATFEGRDGRIAFVARNPGGFDIYTVRPDGTGLLMLTSSGGARDPRYDLTGTRIAYTLVGTSSKDVWVMRDGGHNQKPLIATPTNESEPSWSPDGEWLAFTSDETGRKQVHLHHIPTGVSHQLTFTSDTMRQAWSPAWSPDGRRIAFVGQVPSGQSPTGEFYYKYSKAVMTVRPDGTGLHQVTKSTYMFAQRPDWTPDAKRIIFTNYGLEYRNYCPRPTYWIRADGTDQHRLGPRSCSEWGAVLSPGGDRMALWSSGPWLNHEGDDKPGIYVADSDGSNWARIVTEVRYGAGLDWQPLP